MKLAVVMSILFALGSAFGAPHKMNAEIAPSKIQKMELSVKLLKVVQTVTETLIEEQEKIAFLEGDESAKN